MGDWPMKTAIRLLQGLGLLTLPVTVLAEMLPPPGGPYPSTVVADQPVETAPNPEQLRFPPPDLVAPAPPPPSLSEELGPDFRESPAMDQGLPPVAAPAAAPPSQAADYPAPQQPRATSGYDYATPPAATPGAQGQWPAYGPSYPSVPAPQGNAWPGPAGSGYPAYGWGSYPYGYGAPAYGYGYPQSGYGTDPGWNDSMPTPFGSMPGPWDSMPKSFFPGR